MIQRLFQPEYLKNSARQLGEYLRNPIQGIQNLPDWSWLEIFFHVTLFTAAMGAIAGVVQSSFTSVFYGLLIIPLITLILIFVGAFFFYYFFQVFASRSLQFRKIVILIFFANIPFFIFQTISEFFPPISLIGLAFTGFILIAGFTTQFGLDRRMVARSVILIYALFMLVWLWSRIDAMNFEKSMNQSLQREK